MVGNLRAWAALFKGQVQAHIIVPKVKPLKRLGQTWTFMNFYFFVKLKKI